MDDFLERELKARRERVGGTAVAVKEGKEEEKKEEDGGKTKEEGKKKRKWFFFGGSKGKVENAVDLA